MIDADVGAKNETASACTPRPSVRRATAGNRPSFGAGPGELCACEDGAFIGGVDAFSEFLVEYEAGLRTRGAGLRAGVELRGVAALGSDYGGFSDRTLHRLQVEVGAPWRRSVVTGFARVNLDSFIAELARFTLGVRLDLGGGPAR
jgi:hypothetical protein